MNDLIELIELGNPVPVMVHIGLVTLSVSLLLSLFRLARGPSLPDRVIALDLIAILAVGVLCLFAILVEDSVYLRAATVLALVNFLGTVAFARYLIERKSQ